MAQSESYGVGRIVGFRRCFQGAKPLYHIHDLMFFSPTVTDHRLLYLQWRIFKDLQSVLLTGKQNHSPAVSHGNARGDIGVEEQLFNGYTVRRKHLDKTA